MRLFTAIGVEDLTFDPVVAFKKVKTNLLRSEIEHRWVPVRNYHCTLNFLGEVEEARVHELTQLLSEVALRHSAFELKVNGIDAFPDLHKGRVVWVGVQNTKELRALQEDCSKAIIDSGFPCEARPYFPHLTVARLRNPRNLSDILSPLKNHNFGRLKVRKISLYESQSGGSFPVYKEIAYLPMNDERNLM